MYRLLLVIHVLSAILLLGPAYLYPFLPRLVDTASVPVLKLMRLIERNFMIFLVVQALTGVGLIFSDGGIGLRNNFGKNWWLQLSMTLFIIAGGIGSGYNMPRVRKALEASEAGNEAEARTLLAPVEKVTGPLLGVIGAIIIVLMVWRPGAVGI
jgi:hypothetical protein